MVEIYDKKSRFISIKLTIMAIVHLWKGMTKYSTEFWPNYSFKPNTRFFNRNII